MGEAVPPHSSAGQGRQRWPRPVRAFLVVLLAVLAGLALGGLVVLVIVPRLVDHLALPVALVLELALALLALGCIAAAVYLQSRDAEGR